jgi:replicative DNA helicase
MISIPDQTAIGEHEAALIGAIICRPSVLDEFDLSEADFLDKPLGDAYRELTQLHAAGLLQPGRYAETAYMLECAGLPDEVCKPPHLNRIIDAGFDATYAAYHAQNIAKASRIRLQQSLLHRWSQSLSDGQDAPETILERFTAEAQSLGLTGRKSEVRGFAEIARDVLADLEARRHDKGSVGAVSGIRRLDETTGGWLQGELVILAARPGVGKTALAMQTALHNARKRRRVLVCSLEMRDRELIQRILCGEAGVDSRRLRAGTWTDGDFDQLRQAEHALAETPISVYDASAATVERIAAMARVEHSRGKLGLLVLDYLQLLDPTNKRDQRVEQIAHQSRKLKSLAKELQVPVLCLSQLNRESEKQNREPRLSDLRDSGSIEQDADMVLAIHKTGDVDGQLIVLKHRAGATGYVDVRWDGKATRYSDPTELDTTAFDEGRKDPEWVSGWDS